MGQFFVADFLLQLRSSLVAHGAKLSSKSRRVVDIGSLQPYAHHRAVGRCRLASGHPRPEPVAHWEIPQGKACGLQVVLVHGHVAHFVVQDVHKPALERLRRIGEGEHGPSHQLGGLQFVVPKAMYEFCATLHVRERSPRLSLLGARCDVQPRRASGGQNALGRPPHRVLAAARWRGRLVRQFTGRDVGARPVLERVHMRTKAYC